MAKPKLALIPATQGSKLYSVLPADGVGDFNFSRNTVATRINKDGLIETVAVGKSRLNYPLIDGVVNGCPSHLLEPSSTNITPYSSDFTQWNSLRTTQSNNSSISPDGTLNAGKIVMTSDTGDHTVYDLLSVTSGLDYTSSVFIKRGNGIADWKYFQLKFGGGFLSDSGIVVDVHNGVITHNNNLNDYGIDNYGNGWYRVYITATSNGSTGYSGSSISFNEIPNGFDLNIVGNTNADVYVWGSQFEQNSHKTSYIPTSGSAVTRVAETANGAGDASTFNDSEGVLMAEISALDNDDSVFREISLALDGSNRITLGYNDSLNTIFTEIKVGNVAQTLMTYTLSDSKDFIKMGVKYKQNDFALWVNGFKVSTDNSGIVFNANTLNKLNFDRGTGGSPFYGSAKQIQYFDSALNDSDLEKITSWTSFTDLANGQQYSIK